MTKESVALRVLQYLEQRQSQASSSNIEMPEWDEIANALGVNAEAVERAAQDLQAQGLAEQLAFRSVSITADGLREARSFGRRRWIRNDPAYGYRLAEPHPQTLSDNRVARNEATNIMNSTSGPGAPAYEQARTIRDLLDRDQEVLLKQLPSRRNEWKDQLKKAGWTVLVSVVAGLILWLLVGI
jgi:hypothetical protein